MIHMLGWKPCPTQITPARRGSANASIKDMGIDPDALIKNIK